jgi:type VI secretion system protein ImpK
MQTGDEASQGSESGDHTVFVPKPGGRRRGGAAAVTTAELTAAAPAHEAAAEAPGELPLGIGANPLLRAAAPLFALVRQLKTVRRADDVPRLRRDVIDAIQRFDANARGMRVDGKTTAQAAYALCALVDETVLGTPWGLESVWAKQSLLITFYKEYTAGETFFNFVKKAKERPKEYLDLLEFFFVALSLGFQGRFRLETGGVDQLARLKEDLYNTIARERGRPDPELSVRWRGVTEAGPRVSRLVPLWVAGVAALAICLLAYAGFSYLLNSHSDQVFAKIAGLVPGTTRSLPVSPPAAVPPQLTERVRVSLEPEIRARLVDVEDVGTATRIIIYNRGMFASGQADVGPQFAPLLRKIAAFLIDQDHPGPFVVTGHTDNVPTHGLRFPSNFDLSKARAEAVAAVLIAAGAPATKLKVKGVADTEPLASNDTTEGKAQNRRVEVLIPTIAVRRATP